MITFRFTIKSTSKQFWLLWLFVAGWHGGLEQWWQIPRRRKMEFWIKTKAASTVYHNMNTNSKRVAQSTLAGASTEKKIYIKMNTVTVQTLRPLSRLAARGRSMQIFSARHNIAKPCPFSTDCQAAEKLRVIFEDYRQTHFSMELPSRFRKEVVKVIEGRDQRVALDNFNILLSNIGREDAQLSESELDELVEAAGTSDRRIPTEKAMKLLMSWAHSRLAKMAKINNSERR